MLQPCRGVRHSPAEGGAIALSRGCARGGRQSPAEGVRRRGCAGGVPLLETAACPGRPPMWLDKLEDALSDLAPQRVEEARREQTEAGMDLQKAGQLAETAQKWAYLSLAAMLVWKVVGATWKQCTPVAAPLE